MDILTIFILQVFFSILVWSLLAKWILAPALEGLSLNKSLFWLTLPHASRHVGMVFLVPGVVMETLPSSFAVTTAYGDLLSAILAIITMIALRAGWSGVLALVWVFNIVGTVDLLAALSHPEAVPFLAGAWYIPTLWVPLLLVSHFMIFVRLVRKKR
ncbi:MAG: hypothetical protein JKY84_13165 [Emcibacteraceae bacterium]|nr:hypothetical protein [Emcibacteraceae bacterium]